MFASYWTPLAPAVVLLLGAFILSVVVPRLPDRGRTRWRAREFGGPIVVGLAVLALWGIRLTAGADASGEGLDLLSQAIEIRLYGETVEQNIVLPPSEGRLHARLHELGAVRDEQYDDYGNWKMNLLLQRRDWNALQKNKQLENYIVDDSNSLRLAVGNEGP